MVRRWDRPGLLVLWVLLAVLPALVWAQSDEGGEQAITLAEYRARLAEVEADLARLPADELSPSVDALFRTTQAQLSTIEQVTLPAGGTVFLSPLFGEIDSGGAEITLETMALALARVRLVIEQLEGATHDDTAARLALLEQVLARPEFNPQPSLWQQLRRWLRDWLDWLFPQRTPGASTGLAALMAELITWALALVGAVMLALLLSYWLQGLLGTFVADAEARRRLDAGEDLPLTADAARSEANRQAQIGNFREAVRHLYLSMLLTLEEKGTIRYDRSLTNREVLAQIQRDDSVRAHLQPVVDTFDDVWYGVHEPDRTTFDGYQSEIDRLSELVDERKST